ncbi:D-hexose-6-phosphate mutarotase [Arenimonas sp. MALMAid1274]|uniref:D-hexose-6-phosphate mutarotase n=1 Tax=Arenimonas sp. MALMAid1274 TaxID=3411630 RepID=UPI003B9F3FD3
MTDEASLPDLPAHVQRLPDRGGLAVLRLQGPQGATVEVCTQGAHVLSWRDATGRERLFLSPRARFAPGAAIRGGVPVVFPQFSGRGALPKHGLLRGLPWRLSETSSDARAARLAFEIQDSGATRGLWPHAFHARLVIVLEAGALDIRLQVTNTSPTPFSFTSALHSYLAVADVRVAQVHGLAQRPYEDAADGGEWRVHPDAPLGFDGEVDRVYPEVRSALVLEEPGHRLQVAAEGFPDVVVWNPGPSLAAALVDLGEDQCARFACLEAASVLKPVVLGPGEHWSGGQRLQTA